MRNATSQRRIAEQLRDAANAVRALAIREDEAQVDSATGIPARTTGKSELMPDALDSKSRLAACDGRPGQAMRVVAEKLADCGYDVRGPDCAEGRCLTITNAGCACCDLIVDDGGSVTWDYCPSTGRDTDPAVMTGLVLRVLGAEDTGRGELGTSAHPGLLLKGAVGRALDARGMAVRIAVYEDLFSYDADAEILVTNPARPERGQVRVTDDGDITWECFYSDAASRNTGEIADLIVNVISGGIGPPQAH